MVRCILADSGFVSRLIIALGLLAVSNAASAVPFTFDARTLGMGGTSVATADLATAAWANPSMLTRQRIKDDFALLIGVGAFVRDFDDLIGDIDDFQDADDRRLEAIDDGDPAGEKQALFDMSRTIRGIEGKVVAPEATALFSIGIAFDSFSMAVSVRSDLIAGGTVTDLSCDILTPGCDPSELSSEDFNILNLEGVQSTEYAVSFARDFQLFNRRLSVGVKPKVVALRGFVFQESILTINSGSEDLINKENKVDLGSIATVDMGFAMDLNENWLMGFNLRNLIGSSFDLGDQSISLAPEAEIGFAYKTRFMTLALDYDLTENQPLLSGNFYEGLTTQFISIGAEFSAADYLHLRIGAARNLARGISEAARNTHYSAGFGLWLGFNLDVAVILSEHSVGTMLQTGFRF